MKTSPVTDMPNIFRDNYTAFYNKVTWVCTAYQNNKGENPPIQLLLNLSNWISYKVRIHKFKHT